LNFVRVRRCADSARTTIQIDGILWPVPNVVRDVYWNMHGLTEMVACSTGQLLLSFYSDTFRGADTKPGY
jgi:hypothetical protein